MVMGLGLTVHGGWMLDARGDHACCDRCASAGAAARIARRRLLKAAVFRPADSGASSGARSHARSGPRSGKGSGTRPDGTRPDGTRPDSSAGQAAARAQARIATSGELPRAVTGTVVDVRPHFLVVSHGARQERFALTPDAAAWRGGPLDPAAVWPTGSGRTSAG